MLARVARAIVLLAGASAAIKVGPATPEEVKTIDEAMHKLESMWPGVNGKQMLEDIMSSIPPLDSGAQLQQRLLDRLSSKSPFVFATFGSSVSAGHDNNMNQSWPFELERLLKPTFQGLGFDFELRQRAAGGYGEMPFAAGCMSSRAGTGLDAVSWEWHMFNDSPCEGHHFLQDAASANGRPMVFAFAGSSVRFDADLECPGLEARKCNQAREELRGQVLENKDETFNMPREWKPSEWYFGEQFVSSAELDRFRRESPSKFHVKAEPRSPEDMVWLQRTGVAAQFESDGGAFYPVTISAATKHVAKDPWYQVREKAFNVNWHPGPMGHTLIASAIGHYMLANLKVALSLQDGTGRSEGQGPSLDNPLVGTPITGTQSNPQCGSLRSLTCKTGMHPAIGENYVEYAKDARAANSWVYNISRQFSAARVQMVDERWVYRGTQSDGELNLQVTTNAEDQYLVVCGAPCGWNCNGNAGYVSSKSQRWWKDKDEHPRKEGSDLVYTIDGREVPSAELLSLHDELFAKDTGKFCPDCRNPADLCQPVAKVGAGQHTLGARVSPHSREADWNGEEMFVEIFEIMVVG